MIVPVTAGNEEDSHDIVMSAGHVAAGGVTSCSVINCVPVDKLLQASRATHVLTIVPVPLQPFRPNTLSEKVMMIVACAVQLSVAVAVPVNCVVGFCSQEIVSDGGTVKVGAVLSIITMV